MAKRKTRIHYLADALQQLQKSQEALATVDLRTCRTELRALVKESREHVAKAIETTSAAMRADIPTVPTVPTRVGSK